MMSPAIAAVRESMEATISAPAADSPLLSGVIERVEFGTTILSPAEGRPRRKVVYLDSYGGSAMWTKIKRGLVPAHHLRGCLELVRMGYEVALAEPVPDAWRIRRKPFPHDLALWELVRSWLGPDDILFCGHNVLVWMPFLKWIGIVKCRIVSNIFGCEELPLAKRHSGIIALTPIGAEQARKLAPKVKVAHLGWGVDLSVFPKLPYSPQAFLSCGITLRDHRTLCAAASLAKYPMEVVLPGLDGSSLQWPERVRVIDGGRGWNVEAKKLTYQELLHNHYGHSAGSLLILQRHPWVDQTAAGFTEFIEIMGMARPIIITKTRSLGEELDVEAAGWGIFVEPENPAAIAEAMQYLGDNPIVAERMGAAGRALADRRYNIERFAGELHDFFESL